MIPLASTHVDTYLRASAEHLLPALGDRAKGNLRRQLDVRNPERRPAPFETDAWRYVPQLWVKSCMML